MVHTVATNSDSYTTYLTTALVYTGLGYPALFAKGIKSIITTLAHSSIPWDTRQPATVATGGRLHKFSPRAGTQTCASIMYL